MIKKSNTEKIILGIDPGTNVMGYGVIRIIGNKAELVVMGVIDMRKESDPYLRLGKIFDRVTGIIDSYLPDEMAIEAPFFGKNVQSMLKLGRAQGVAIAAAIHHSVPIHEYAPLKIKMVKAQETIKDVYTQEELCALIQPPKREDSFVVWRSWAIINFILGTAAREATVCEMQIHFTVL